LALQPEGSHTPLGRVTPIPCCWRTPPGRGHKNGTATIRSSGFPPRNAPNSIRRPWAFVGTNPENSQRLIARRLGEIWAGRCPTRGLRARNQVPFARDSRRICRKRKGCLTPLVVSWRFLTSRHVRELIYLLFFSNSFSSMRDGAYSTKSLGHVSLALRKRARASGRSPRIARYSPT